MLNHFEGICPFISHPTLLGSRKTLHISGSASIPQVPYTLHIVTQLPQHKHLHEESNAKNYIEEKVAPEPRNIGFYLPSGYLT